MNWTALDNGTGVVINVNGNVTIEPTGVIDGEREGFKAGYGRGYLATGGGTYGVQADSLS